MHAGCLDTQNNREMLVDGSNILSIQDEHALSHCTPCSLGTDVVHYCTSSNRDMFVEGSNILSIQDEHALSHRILCNLGTDVVHYCMKSSPGIHADYLDTRSNREMLVDGLNIVSIPDAHALCHCILCSLGTDVVDCCMKSSPGMHADYLDTQSNREMFVEGSNILSIQDEHALSHRILCNLGTDVVHYCMKSSPGMHADCLGTRSRSGRHALD